MEKQAQGLSTRARSVSALSLEMTGAEFGSKGHASFFETQIWVLARARGL
jgi:hypothetical protein